MPDEDNPITEGAYIVLVFDAADKPLGVASSAGFCADLVLEFVVRDIRGTVRG